LQVLRDDDVLTPEEFQVEKDSIKYPEIYEVKLTANSRVLAVIHAVFNDSHAIYT
jgi:hypothetical protein